MPHSTSRSALKPLPAHPALNSVTCVPTHMAFFFFSTSEAMHLVCFDLSTEGQRKGSYTSPVSNSHHHTSACRWTCCDLARHSVNFGLRPTNRAAKESVTSTAQTGKGKTAVVWRTHGGHLLLSAHGKHAGLGLFQSPH